MVISFIETSLDDERPFVILGNIRELIGRHVIHNSQSTEAERKLFPGPYKIILQKKLLRLPLRRRIRLKCVNTGVEIMFGLKKIRRMFQLMPIVDSDRIWEKMKQSIHIK